MKYSKEVKERRTEKNLVKDEPRKRISSMADSFRRWKKTKSPEHFFSSVLFFSTDHS